MRKKALVDKSGSLRPAVAVVDPDIGGRGRAEDLALVFEAGIGLDHRDGVVPRRMGFEVSVPKEPIAPTTTTASQTHKAALQGPVKRSQHHLRPLWTSLFLCLFAPKKGVFRCVGRLLWVRGNGMGILIERGREGAESGVWRKESRREYSVKRWWKQTD